MKTIVSYMFLLILSVGIYATSLSEDIQNGPSNAPICKAKGLLGGSCELLFCPEGSYANCEGGFFTATCGCLPDPSYVPSRNIPSIGGIRTAAENFIQWAGNHTSEAVNQMGQTAQAVLDAVDQADQTEYSLKEHQFANQWTALDSQDAADVKQWQDENGFGE